MRVRRYFTQFVGAMVVGAVPASACSQIFVANSGSDTIGEYSSAGATLNESLVPTAPLFSPKGIAVSGGFIYVANFGNNTISKFTTSGALVSASLVPTGPLFAPSGLAVSGDKLFVANWQSDTISEFTTSGALVSASLVPTAPLNRPSGIAVCGDKLFVANYGADTISEFTTSGALVSASLVPTGPLFAPSGIVVSDNNLFVANYSSDTISEFTTSGGLVSASLVPTGPLFGPSGIAVSGGKLFVANYDSDTISEFTTAGSQVAASLVATDGLASPAGLVVVPSAWTGQSNSSWAAAGNWTDVVPGATTGTTDDDTAVFNQLAGQSPLAIDHGRNIRNIVFDTAQVNSLTIGMTHGNPLLLTAGGYVRTTASVINPETVNAPLLLDGSYTLESDAAAAMATLNFGGLIMPAVTSGTTTLTLAGSNNGGNSIAGILADTGTGRLAVVKNGTGLWILSGANTYSGGTTVVEGTLRFDVISGTPSVAAGTTATVNAGATLELAGSISALSSGSSREYIDNNSNAPGVLVSGTNQQVGNIYGSGTTQVNAGSDLTATHIIQSALVIGGTASSHGLVTIDASDISGNPLARIAVLSSPTSAFPLGADPLGYAANGGPLLASSLSPLSTVSVTPAAVPEPPSLILLVVGLLALTVGRRCRWPR